MTAVPAYLATMPLHAITEIYGEDGLRARFAIEVERFDAADRRRLSDALALATRLHRDDRRVREPYLNHLLRVAIRPICYYEVADVDVIVAALLHDAVEDHPAELAAIDGAAGAGADVVEAALAVLARRFGQRVSHLVRAVTTPPHDPASSQRDRHERYREFVAASLDRSPWARVIKISDFTDNGVGVVHTTGPKVASSAAKYQPMVPILRELIARPDTPLSRWAKQHIFDQLDLAEERFRMILDDSAAYRLS